MKFNENENMRVTKVLEEIFHAEMSCDSFFNGFGGYAHNKRFNKVNRTIHVYIHKPSVEMAINPVDENVAKENRIIHLEFHNCILTKIGDQELSYESEDEIISRTATFTFDYMLVKGNGINGVNNTCKTDME